MAILIATVLRGLYGASNGLDVLLICIVGILPFLEICPECGKLVWRERTSDWRTGVLWIGDKCRITGR
jgi:hypothetical protein